MQKLKNKITGNVFVLPEEEVKRILNADRFNSYVVIEGGIEVEPKEEVQEVASIEDFVVEDEEEVKPLGENAPLPDYESMTNAELKTLCKKLGIVIGVSNPTKAILIKKLNEYVGV